MRKTLGSPVHKRLIDLLVKRRNELGVTQEEVARRLEVRQQILANIEQGERRIDVAEFFQIADALDLDAAKILRDLASVHKPLHRR